MENAPEKTVSLAIVLEDKDAYPVTGGFAWIHWLAANITRFEIKDNESQTATDFVQGRNSWTSIQGGEQSIEFWLLLHFDRVFELDREKLLNNPKVTTKRRYVEQELRRLWPGYKKSSYRAEELVKYIDNAINNEKEFCEDIVELENSVGSNIGKLIIDMRTHSN